MIPNLIKIGSLGKIAKLSPEAIVAIKKAATAPRVVNELEPVGEI